MRAEAPIIWRSKLERINGVLYENTGELGIVEKISWFRVCIAGSIIGTMAFVGSDEYSSLGRIIITICGICIGAYLGKECTIKKEEIIKRKVLTSEEFRKDVERREIQAQIEKYAILKIPNVFKLIWR